MSGYKYNEVFSLISKTLSILGMICYTWGGWAHRPRSSPAHRSSPLVLDPLGRSVLLRDCLDALSCCLTRHTPRNVQCSCPSGAEKCTINPVYAALIAIAAHKLSVRIKIETWNSVSANFLVSSRFKFKLLLQVGPGVVVWQYWRSRTAAATKPATWR
jgi:hypothetical protein